MTEQNQITLRKALELVEFEFIQGAWRVKSVNSNIHGDVNSSILGRVYGDVYGDVYGTINGHEWKFVETPKEKLQRLIEESGSQELIDTFNQLEDS